MIPFDLWTESFIFASIYSVLILVPCVLVAFLGRKMVNQLGHYPTKTPAIQMSIFFQLVVIEVITFTLMLTFYHFFSGK